MGKIVDKDESKVEGKKEMIAKGFNSRTDCWYLFASYHYLKSISVFERHNSFLGMVCITINASLKLAKGLSGCLVLSHSQHVKSHRLRQRSALTCT